MVNCLKICCCCKFIGKDEQLVLDNATERVIINGPKVHRVPLTSKRAKVQKATTLTDTQYCVIKNTMSGKRRVVVGPTLVFLEPYDEFVGYPTTKAVISLQENEYVRFLDEATGKIRVVVGEKGCVVPTPTEVIVDKEKQKAIDLKTYEYVRIEDKKTGAVRVERGEKLVYLGPYEKIMKPAAEQPVKMSFVTATDQTIIEANSRMSAVLEQSAPKVAPLIRSDSLNSINGSSPAHELSPLIVDKTPKIPRKQLLRPYEAVIKGSASDKTGKQMAIEIDEETAVLIRNKRSGQQHLVQEQQLFVPGADEEILKVQSLIKLASHEACLVRGKDGQDKFYFGKNEAESSFFLPPYSTLVKQCWSRGRKRTQRTLFVEKIDLRPAYMSFEFNCRTSDNVELVLEGSFFWQIFDPEAMVRFTSNPTGDICNHARAQFIEKVSRVSLQTFMGDFNKIAQEAHKEDNEFYLQRGITIHSLEVTRYSCAEKETAMVLGQIIQETTNRMNRLQQQESESEVKLFKIKAQIEEEEARRKLLNIQTENSNSAAAMEGLAEAEKVKQFMTELEGNIPSLDTRIALWNVLRKREALAEVSGGDAKIFFTPNDVNLSIETTDKRLSSIKE